MHTPTHPGTNLTLDWPARHCELVADATGPNIDALNALKPLLNDGGLVILTGCRGSGKTMMAVRYAYLRSQLCFRTSRRNTYVRAQHMFSEIKRSWSTGEPYENELSTTGFLCIDEIHERADTDWEYRTLTTIIDRRYGDKLPTILIANMPDDQLSRSLGSSIVDRANETGGVLTCDWPSYRS